MDIKKLVDNLITGGYSPRRTRTGFSTKDIVDPSGFIVGVEEVKDFLMEAESDKSMLIELAKLSKANVLQIAKEMSLQFRRHKAKELEESPAFLFQETALALDIFDGDYFLFNPTTTAVLPESPDAFLAALDPAEAIDRKQTATLARREYNPGRPSRCYQVEHRGYNLTVFNSYVPPKWMSKKIDNPIPPNFFFKFMNRLFPDTESRGYALKWIKNMLVGRNDTMLCLITDPGTGKNTLSILCSKLVGDHNFYKPRDTFFNSQFNSEISNKRLIYFDEVCISLRNKEILKGLLNETVSVEKKGVDPIMYPNHASYMLANNIKNGNRIEAKDRRFSIPDATDEKLLDGFEEEEVTTFIDSISDPDSIVLANIGHWFMKTVSLKGFGKAPFKGKTFVSLSQLSLWDWEKFLIEKIFSRTESHYMWSEIKMEFGLQFGAGSKFAGPSHTKLFLSSYVDPEGDAIATSEQDGTDLKIIPTKKYSKKEAESDFDDIEMFT